MTTPGRRKLVAARRYCYRYTVFIDSTHAIKANDLMVCVGRGVHLRPIMNRRHNTRLLELTDMRRERVGGRGK